MTSSDLPPMVEQCTGHVIQSETSDRYTALSVGVLLHIYIYEFSYQFHETVTLDITFMGRDQELK